jgi:predicted lipoprotein with Yx(FWY)xxD motif
MRFAILVCSLTIAAGLVLVASGPASAEAVVTVKPGASDYGRILLDGKGFALYAFTRDGRGRSQCSGACARAWPPYIARGAVKPGAGTAAGKLGVTQRAGGRKQVTFDGRPLYYYVGDRQPGQVLCQNVSEFGGLWLVVRPSGRLVR